MAVGKRLSKIAKECNVGISTIVDFLHKKGFKIESNPNTKVSEEMYDLLKKEYRSDLTVKMESEKLVERKQKGKKSSVSIDDVKEEKSDEEEVAENFESDKSASEKKKSSEKSEESKKEEEKKEDTAAAPSKSQQTKMDVKVVGKIDLDKKKEESEEEVSSQSSPKEESHEEVSMSDDGKSSEEKTPESEEVEEKVTEHSEEDVSSAQKGTEPEKSETPKAEEHREEGREETPGTEKTQEEQKPSEEETQAPDKKQDQNVKVVGKIDLGDSSSKSGKTSYRGKKDVKKENEKAPSPKKKTAKKPEGKTGQQTEQAKPIGFEGKEKESKKPAPQAGENQDVKPPMKEEVPEDKGEQQGEEPKTEKQDQDSFVPTKVKKLSGPTVVGKIDLPASAKENGNTREEQKNKKKKKRKRIRKEKERVNINEKQQQQKATSQQGDRTQEKKEKKKKSKARKRPTRPEVNEEDVQKQVKETLARLTSKGKSKASRHRREKRDAVSQKQHEEMERISEESNVLKVTEFVTANELANLMDVQVNQVISTCMSLGLFVSINQRLDAETISLVAEEYGYKVEFISVDAAETIEEEQDKPEELKPRPPIITVMGHVDHGKTSLLDHIRRTNVIAGESGGITQHIGAYNVELENGRAISFLDTPGHEAFTAMRARGAQITDIAIIIVAADDNVKPQTIEAINHASAAGVPIVFAINKVDKPNANPDKVKEELANMNYLVEEWGGKYQSQDISAKNGEKIEELLEKVLLESDLLELKANPSKPAVGSVIESTLDKGRGFVATLLVQAGTLRSGDLILSGQFYGHVKAMFNERNQPIEKAGPSEPVLKARPSQWVDSVH